jgi:hypothetical protein
MNETCCDQGYGVWISNGKIVTTSPSATKNQPVQSTSTSLGSTMSSITISVYSVLPTSTSSTAPSATTQNQPVQSTSTSLGSTMSSITIYVYSTSTSSPTPALSESAKIGLGVGISISVLTITVAVLIYHHYWTRRHPRLTPGLAAATPDKNIIMAQNVPPNPMQYQQQLPVSELANNMATQQYSQHPVPELPNNAVMQHGVPQQSHGYEAHGGNARYELPARNG